VHGTKPQCTFCTLPLTNALNVYFLGPQGGQEGLWTRLKSSPSFERYLFLLRLYSIAVAFCFGKVDHCLGDSVFLVNMALLVVYVGSCLLVAV
jgi:hypothetical protein